jgi:type II secretory pathway pseudopilin PulG
VPTHARRDAGETLVEIMFTIVIIGLTVTALLSSLGTVGKAGNAQRNGVKADFVLRGYAEATKLGAQSCTVGATYTVTYTPPTGFTPSVTPVGNACPPVATPKLLQLKVLGPLGLQETLQIKVSTP